VRRRLDDTQVESQETTRDLLSTVHWRTKVLMSRSSHHKSILSDAVLPQRSRERHLLKTATKTMTDLQAISICIQTSSLSLQSAKSRNRDRNRSLSLGVVAMDPKFIAGDA